MDFDFPLPPLPGEILPEAEPEPDWKIYEHSIAHIEESYENCKVTRNHKPVGRRSGVQRQVDVWLEAEVGDNHIVTVAIECRRYADRPVSIKDIDAFCGFLDDVGANKGVIAQPERRTFKQFFEAAPPDSREEVTERAGPLRSNNHGGQFRAILTPNLELHCDTCDGVRIFEYRSQYPPSLSVKSKADHVALDYACRNCKESEKKYYLLFWGDGGSGAVQKVGEYPAFSPPTPRRLFELIGEDHREMFLKGRRAENRGLGIGAYAYYRRIVEDQKDAIVDEIIEVAKRVGTNDETLKTLAELKDEKQFKTAIDKLKKGFPESLLIDGCHNPLLLLHNALSKGIHEMADEECLELATSIRVVLSELAERIANMLKEKAELSKAVGRLLKARHLPGKIRMSDFKVGQHVMLQLPNFRLADCDKEKQTRDKTRRDRSTKSALWRNHHRAGRAHVGGKICADGPSCVS